MGYQSEWRGRRDREKTAHCQIFPTRDREAITASVPLREAPNRAQRARLLEKWRVNCETTTSGLRRGGESHRNSGSCYSEPGPILTSMEKRMGQEDEGGKKLSNIVEGREGIVWAPREVRKRVTEKKRLLLSAMWKVKKRRRKKGREMLHWTFSQAPPLLPS